MLFVNVIESMFGKTAQNIRTFLPFLDPQILYFICKYGVVLPDDILIDSKTPRGFTKL